MLASSLRQFRRKKNKKERINTSLGRGPIIGGCRLRSSIKQDDIYMPSPDPKKSCRILQVYLIHSLISQLNKRSITQRHTATGQPAPWGEVRPSPSSFCVDISLAEMLPVAFTDSNCYYHIDHSRIQFYFIFAG